MSKSYRFLMLHTLVGTPAGQAVILKTFWGRGHLLILPALQELSHLSYNEKRLSLM